MGIVLQSQNNYSPSSLRFKTCKKKLLEKVSFGLFDKLGLEQGGRW